MRRFKIAMKTLLGIKIGELVFWENAEAISGFLNLLYRKNDIRGFLAANGDILFSGSITSLIRTIPFHAEGKIENGRIALTVHTENNDFPLSGTEETDDHDEKKGIENECH